MNLVSQHCIEVRAIQGAKRSGGDEDAGSGEARRKRTEGIVVEHHGVVRKKRWRLDALQPVEVASRRA